MPDGSSRDTAKKQFQDGIVILGMSCFWIWALLGLGGIDPSPANANVTTLVSLAATALTNAILTLVSVRFEKSSARRPLQLAILLLSLLGPLELLFGHNLIPDLPLLHSATSGVIAGGLMLLWGLTLTSMDTRRVIPLVSISTMLATAGFAVGVGVSSDTARLMTAILPTLSTVLLLWARVHAPVSPQSSTSWKQRSPFYFGRAFFGLMIGLVTGLTIVRGYEPLGGTGVRLLALGIGIALLLALATALVLGDRLKLNTKHLSVLPILAAGFLLFPLMGTSFDIVSQVAAATAWLSWMILSSIQLSGLKTTFGMSAARLSFSEKAVVGIMWVVGYLAGLQLDRLLGAGFNVGLLGGAVSLVLAYTTVIVATFSLGQYVALSATLRTSPTEDLTQLISLTCQNLASRFSLTPREAEFLTFLAAGRSLPYIERALRISSGTAKTHVYHIHQKLGVHTQQELLDLVRQQGGKAQGDG